jgi:hypothetical protein
MELISKYPNLRAAVERPEGELREDLKRALAIQDADPNSDDGIRAWKVAAWIGQALRMRTPGLNGPLAWAGRPLVVRVPSA